MRNIPDEFLGALFGAWIGVATEIWNEPVISIIIFVGVLVIIALLLDIVAGPFHIYVRLSAGTILFFVAIAAGVVFAWAPALAIFQDERQIIFFWALLAAWLSVGIFPTIMNRRLPAGSGGGAQ